MNTFGLLGYPLSHSFSKKYFTEKFLNEKIKNCEYKLFEYQNVKDFIGFIEKSNNIIGFNVTIPHKLAIIPHLHELKEEAKKAGAVNVVKITNDKKLIGYNSDYFGFSKSLEEFINGRNMNALVLGTGGASKAVAAVLKDIEMPFQFVSRTNNDNQENVITYQQVSEAIINNYHLLINTTPLGMYPKTENAPAIPYQFLTSGHYLFDLVYNPKMTIFLQKGLDYGANIKNGLDMLYYQAEKAWEIWND